MPQNRKCPDCGADIPSDAPLGLCQACLLEGVIASGETVPFTQDPQPAAITAPPEGLPPDSQVQYFGDYLILNEIARGGMGVVYKAKQVSLNRLVALKMILSGQLAGEAEVRRFRTEAEAAANLAHPNIVPIFEIGEHRGQHYFSMELIEGPSLASKSSQFVRDLKSAVRLVATVARAVHHAHQRGIIHRDLTPRNILLDPDGVPHVTDFGLARRVDGDGNVTQSGAIVGTPNFMAPEQACGQTRQMTTAVDIWSTGVILYLLITGSLPFAAETVPEILRRIVQEEPKRPRSINPKIDRDLEALCMKCLEKEHQRRFASAAALAEELEHWLQGRPIITRPCSSWERLSKWAKRKPAVAALSAIVALVAFLGFTGILWQWRRAELNAAAEAAAKTRADRERERAQEREAQAKTTLSASDFLQAVRLIKEQRPDDAVAYLVRSLTNNPANDAARTRLASLLAYQPWITPGLILEHAGDADSAQLSPDRTRILTLSGGSARVWDAQSGKPMTPPLPVASPTGRSMPAAEFSPNGERVLTVARSEASVWDARTGQPVGSPLRHEATINSAHFSRDGERIVTASADGSARLWSTQTGKPLTAPLQHEGPVHSAEFSPDGLRIVTASWGLVSASYDLGLEREHSDSGPFVPGASPPPPDAFPAQPVSPGENRASSTEQPETVPLGQRTVRIVRASIEHQARVWDARTGQPVGGALSHEGPVNVAHFSLDGKRMLQGSSWGAWDKIAALLPMTQTVVRVQLSEGDVLFEGGNLTLAQFSPDGKRVVMGSEHAVCVWDADSGEPVIGPLIHEPLIHGTAVDSVQYDPSGELIVSIARGIRGTTQIWNAQNGQRTELPMRVICLEFSPSGEWLLVASGSEVRVVDSLSGQSVTAPLKHDSSVSSAHFSQDGKQIITVSAGIARLWDVRGVEPVPARMRNPGWVRTIECAPDGKRILTTCEHQGRSTESMACLWDSETAAQIHEPLKHGHLLSSAHFSPDANRIVTTSYGDASPPFRLASDGTARVWQSQTGRLLAETPSQQFTNQVSYRKSVSAPPVLLVVTNLASLASAQFSADGNRIVTAAFSLNGRDFYSNPSDGCIRVWDARTGLPQTGPLKHDQVRSACFSPDDKLILSTGRGARVWDAQDGRLLCDFPTVEAAEFSPRGNRIITTLNQTVQVLDATTGKPVIGPLRHRYRVHSAHFSPNGAWILTAAGSEVLLWDAQTGERVADPIRVSEQLVASPQFSRDGKLIVAVSKGNAVQVWDVRTGEAVAGPFQHKGLVTAEFCPDGRRIITSDGEILRVWDLAPSDPQLPGWLLLLAEALCGETLNNEGVLVSTKLDRAAVIKQIQKELNDSQRDDDWIAWGRWFLADPSARTSSPFSKVTARQFIEDAIKENTVESLSEAQRLACGNPDVMQRVVKARLNLEAVKARERTSATTLSGEASR